MTSGNMLPTILLNSGNYFDFLKPETSVFEITDIAHGLSNICRFGGQCKEFYSVAQHSVIASSVIESQYAYDALMHDAAEAFVGDIPSPLKMLLPEYKTIEKHAEAAIAQRFGVSNPLPQQVKNIDIVLLATEHRDLMPEHDDEWGLLVGVTPLKQKIRPWTPKEAYETFMRRYNFLTEHGKDGL